MAREIPERRQLLMTLNEGSLERLDRGKLLLPTAQTPSETIRSQTGSSRDLALLMMEAARSFGFAARFVTGYIYVPERDGPIRLGGASTRVVPDLLAGLGLD